MILECVSSVILVDGKVNADVMIHALVLSLFPRVLNVSSIEKYTFWFNRGFYFFTAVINAVYHGQSDVIKLVLTL